MAETGLTGVLISDGLGDYRVRVTQIDLDLTIVSTTEEAANHRAFYPSDVTSSNFALTLAFPSFASREKFNQWMSRFMEKVVREQVKTANMRIEVPSRNFTRSAVPQGPLLYGQGSRDVAYFTRVTFCGAHDPADKIEASTFRMATIQSQVSKHFYPVGKQLRGAADMDGTLFDTTPGLVDGWAQSLGAENALDDAEQTSRGLLEDPF